MTTHSLAKCYLVDQNDISEMAKIQMAVAEEREFAESSSSATENSDDQDWQLTQAENSAWTQTPSVLFPGPSDLDNKNSNDYD